MIKEQCPVCGRDCHLMDDGDEVLCENPNCPYQGMRDPDVGAGVAVAAHNIVGAKVRLFGPLFEAAQRHLSGPLYAEARALLTPEEPK